MQLSNKQLSALAEEIFKEIRPLQVNQLNSFKDEYRKTVEKNLLKNFPNLKTMFKIVDGKSIVSIRLSREFMSKITGKDDRELDCKSMDTLISKIYNNTIKDVFEARFGKEASTEYIERLLILETIGANTVEELIAGVKKKFGL